LERIFKQELIDFPLLNRQSPKCSLPIENITMTTKRKIPVLMFGTLLNLQKIQY